MAIIYDFSTRKVITDPAILTDSMEDSDDDLYLAAAASSASGTANQQTNAACDAYMLLLQRLLKEL